MTNLTLIGLGLHDEKGISLQGLEKAKRATYVFAEFYTNYMPAIKISNIEKLIGKQVKILSRKEVEDHAQEKILVHAKKYPCAFLTPGDPNIATTHIDLRLRAEKEGIRTSIIHSASISSANVTGSSADTTSSAPKSSASTLSSSSATMKSSIFLLLTTVGI